MEKIYIKYMVGDAGPYMAIFNSQSEAEEWVSNTSDDLHITSIDRM